MRISNYESKNINELPAVQIKVASSNPSGLAICFQYNNRSTRIMFSDLENRLVIVSIGRETGHTVERIEHLLVLLAQSVLAMPSIVEHGISTSPARYGNIKKNLSRRKQRDSNP